MRKNTAFIILGILFSLNIIAWAAVLDLSGHKFLEVNFFDVGQGDSIFVETLENQQILIDGGPDSQVIQRLAREMPFWDRTIDLVILTHPEKDHLAGLLDVLKRYKVENILWTGVIRDTPEFVQWQKEILEEGVNIKIAQAGEKVIASNAILEILNPLENVSGQPLQDSNDTSIVSRLVFGSSSFLFTGDIEQTAEKALVNSGENLASEVLKVAHHGSKTSTSEEFLRKVLPQIAVIPVGQNNSYGHPTQQVLDILGKYGIKILRTDQQGNIKIISDGEKLTISNFQN